MPPARARPLTGADDAGCAAEAPWPTRSTAAAAERGRAGRGGRAGDHGPDRDADVSRAARRPGPQPADADAENVLGETEADEVGRAPRRAGRRRAQRRRPRTPTRPRRTGRTGDRRARRTRARHRHARRPADGAGRRRRRGRRGAGRGPRGRTGRGEPPVAGYDELPSRSCAAGCAGYRLEQVEALVAYEQATRRAGRPYLRMLENRLTCSRAGACQADGQPRPPPRRPWPVRTVARKIADWIGRLGEVWVEGQVAQLSRRGGATAFLTLRDPAADMSVPVTCHRDVLDASGPRSPRAPAWSSGPGPTTTSPAGSLLAAGDRDPRGRARRAAGPDRADPPAARRRGAVRRRTQAAAAVPAASVVGLITGRAARPSATCWRTPGAAGPPSASRCATAPVQGPTAVPRGHRRAAPAGRRPDGRGHRGRPRRRLGRGPAAVLRRGAGARGRGLPHAGGHRDRPRARHDAARPRRRRPRLHARPTPASASSPDVGEELRWWTGCAPGPRGCSAPGGPRAGRAGALRRSGRRCVDRTRWTAVPRGGRPARPGPPRPLVHRVDGAEPDLDHARARVAALSPAATLQRGYAVVQRRRRHASSGTPPRPARRRAAGRVARPAARRVAGHEAIG